MSGWYVYLVRCGDNSLYTGITTDVARRLKAHNQGKGAAYTRGRQPIKLMWNEEVKSESVARKREAQIKRLTRSQKDALL